MLSIKDSVLKRIWFHTENNYGTGISTPVYDNIAYFTGTYEDLSNIKYIRTNNLYVNFDNMNDLASKIKINEDSYAYMDLTFDLHGRIIKKGEEYSYKYSGDLIQDDSLLRVYGTHGELVNASHFGIYGYEKYNYQMINGKLRLSTISVPNYMEIFKYNKTAQLVASWNLVNHNISDDRTRIFKNHIQRY